MQIHTMFDSTILIFCLFFLWHCCEQTSLIYNAFSLGSFLQIQVLFLALEVAQPLRNTLVIFLNLIRDIFDDSLLNDFYSTSSCDNIFETYAIFYPVRLPSFFILS